MTFLCLAKKIINSPNNITIMASWTDALKEYAKVKGKFVLPKKDSEDYKAVKELQAKMKPKTLEADPEVHPVTKAKIERRKKQSPPEGVIPKPVEEKPVASKKHAIQPEVPRSAKPVPISATVVEEAPKRLPRKAKKTTEPVAPTTPVAPVAPAKRSRKERPVKVEIQQKPTVLTF